jgi:hypothetical protein
MIMSYGPQRAAQQQRHYFVWCGGVAFTNGPMRFVLSIFSLTATRLLFFLDLVPTVIRLGNIVP